MQWHPVGPGFVFGPRDATFDRLSRRNERGEQGMVQFIALDPTDPATIYTLDRPSWGGRSAFRTRDGAASWTSILDPLVENDLYVAPNCLAINPAHPGTLYLGTGWDEGQWKSFGIYTSNDRGDHWVRAGFNQNIAVYQLLVDPRTAGDLVKTTLVAGTDNGIWFSLDGGATWTSVSGVSGRVSSLVADYPKQGDATYYAGVVGQGVFIHSGDKDLSQPWTNLNGKKIGLPAVTDEPFDQILIDVCRSWPSRVYAWHFSMANSVGLFTTDNANAGWTEAAPANKLPMANQWWYCFAFAVAPNSPGDGKNDVLFFTPRRMARSIDSGNTWVGIPDSPDLWFHEDGHSFAFRWNGVGLPLFYHGCDGGVCVSDRYADPKYDVSTLVDFDEGLTYDTSNGVVQNLNHGRQASAVLSMANHPDMPAMTYIGCQDTGTAGGDGLVWRAMYDADVGQVACAPGDDGVKVWTGVQVPSELWMGTDGGGNWPTQLKVALDDGGAPLSNSFQGGNRGFAIGLDRNGYAGAFVWDRSTQFGAAVAIGLNWATPVSMAHLHRGTVLGVQGETVVVADVNQTQFKAQFIKAHGQAEGIDIQSTTSITADVVAGAKQWVKVASLDELTVGAGVGLDGEALTILALDAPNVAFQADVTQPHKAPVGVRLVETYVVRCTHDARAQVISQNFSPDDPRVVATSPIDANVAYCATVENRIYRADNATKADAKTVWREITGQGIPKSPPIVSIAIDPADTAYLSFLAPVASGNVTSPLFKFNGDPMNPVWTAQACNGLPAPRWFGPIATDPVRTDTVYATADSRVYRLTLAGGQWSWTDISAGLPRDGGLPKQFLPTGLCALNLGDAKTPRVLLRAGIFGQGVWEAEVTPGAADPSIRLYVRDNVMDQGWLVPPPSGMQNPYRPAETVQSWQCRDIKFDVIQSGQGKVADFFQTEPEGDQPLSYVLFEQLKDARDRLTPLVKAQVHVQVHNRGHTAAGNVSVWALWADGSKGVPALDARGNKNVPFDFWVQFAQDGKIYPSLPADSAWQAFGAPVVLSGIEAGNPQVATWPWTVPFGFNATSYCVGIFVHSPTSLLNDTSLDLTELTPRQPQVGQLYVAPPLKIDRKLFEILHELYKPLLRGSRDTIKFFVDPLWDPAPEELQHSIRALVALERRTEECLAKGLQLIERTRAADAGFRRVLAPAATRDEVGPAIGAPDHSLSGFRRLPATAATTSIIELRALAHRWRYACSAIGRCAVISDDSHSAV